MTKSSTIPELVCKAAAYCSVAERCESEVITKLHAWAPTLAENDISHIINYLYDNNYLSNERYCVAFVHDKLLYQGWGREKIRLMLQVKHLPKAAIAEALEQIDESQYLCVLQKVAETKSRSLRNAPQQREKLIRFLLSRGFTYCEIERAISI